MQAVPESGAAGDRTAADKLIQRLADAQREQEEATMGLIQIELDGILTGLAAAEDQARRRAPDG